MLNKLKLKQEILKKKIIESNPTIKRRGWSVNYSYSQDYIYREESIKIRFIEIIRFILK